MNEIEPRTGGVERRENNGSRRPVSIQQDHQHVDEQALIVRPVDDQVTDQRQYQRAAIGRGRSSDSPNLPPYLESPDSSRRFRVTIATSVLFLTLSFFMMLLRCTFTVFSLILSL